MEGKFGFVGAFFCLPQRVRGTAKRWMRRANCGLVSGVISIYISMVSTFTLMNISTRSPHPSRPTGAPPSPLGKAKRRGRQPDKLQFELSPKQDLLPQHPSPGLCRALLGYGEPLGVTHRHLDPLGKQGSEHSLVGQYPAGILHVDQIGAEKAA